MPRAHWLASPAELALHQERNPVSKNQGGPASKLPVEIGAWPPHRGRGFTGGSIGKWGRSCRKGNMIKIHCIKNRNEVSPPAVTQHARAGSREQLSQVDNSQGGHPSACSPHLPCPILLWVPCLLPQPPALTPGPPPYLRNTLRVCRGLSNQACWLTAVRTTPPISPLPSAETGRHRTQLETARAST